jgi:hypothetical protein
MAGRLGDPEVDFAMNLHSRRGALLVFGVLGTVGALLILIADVVYHRFGGDELGPALYITSYFGIFLFPLWWAGIWVLYQGLRPAGISWSLLPCLLFAFLVSTVNVAGHASYPFWAAIEAASQSPDEAAVLVVRRLAIAAAEYTGGLGSIQTVLEVVISIWIAIPILRGRTLFPRWLALLIPIFPMLALLLIGVWTPRFFEAAEPFVGSGSMVFAFAAATVALLRNGRAMRCGLPVAPGPSEPS